MILFAITAACTILCSACCLVWMYVYARVSAFIARDEMQVNRDCGIWRIICTCGKLKRLACCSYFCTYLLLHFPILINLRCSVGKLQRELTKKEMYTRFAHGSNDLNCVVVVVVAYFTIMTLSYIFSAQSKKKQERPLAWNKIKASSADTQQP